MGQDYYNFYAEDLNNGDSILPFLGFLIFLAGVIVIVVGVVNFVLVWREFRLWYDASALEEKPDTGLKKKKMIKYGIVIAVGILMIAGSYLL